MLKSNLWGVSKTLVPFEYVYCINLLLINVVIIYRLLHKPVNLGSKTSTTTKCKPLFFFSHINIFSCISSKKRRKHSPFFHIHILFIFSYFTFRSVFSSLVSPLVGGGVKLGSLKNKKKSCLHLKLKMRSTIKLCYLKLGYPKLPAVWNSNYCPLKIIFILLAHSTFLFPLQNLEIAGFKFHGFECM